MSAYTGYDHGYHHGDLRATLLRAAAEAITQRGVADLTLRGLAREAGVSHAAPAHHFTDKAGLFTALATQGHELLATALAEARDLVDMGVAYVDFAVQHPAHFEVMFRPDLLHVDDTALQEAGTRSAGELRAAVVRRGATDVDRMVTAAWSLVHGYATLLNSGVLVADDPGAVTRSIATLLAPASD